MPADRTPLLVVGVTGEVAAAVVPAVTGVTATLDDGEVVEGAAATVPVVTGVMITPDTFPWTAAFAFFPVVPRAARVAFAFAALAARASADKGVRAFLGVRPKSARPHWSNRPRRDFGRDFRQVAGRFIGGGRPAASFVCRRRVIRNGSTGTGYESTGTGHGSTGTGYGSTGTGYEATGTGYGSTGTGYGSTGRGHGGTFLRYPPVPRGKVGTGGRRTSALMGPCSPAAPSPARPARSSLRSSRLRRSHIDGLITNESRPRASTRGGEGRVT